MLSLVVLANNFGLESRQHRACRELHAPEPEILEAED